MSQLPSTAALVDPTRLPRLRQRTVYIIKLVDGPVATPASGLNVTILAHLRVAYPTTRLMCVSLAVAIRCHMTSTTLAAAFHASVNYYRLT